MGVEERLPEAPAEEARQPEVETSLIEEFGIRKPARASWETVESNCEAAGVKVITDANVVEKFARSDGKTYPWCTRIPRATAPKWPRRLHFLHAGQDLVNAVGASDQPARRT